MLHALGFRYSSAVYLRTEDAISAAAPESDERTSGLEPQYRHKASPASSAGSAPLHVRVPTRQRDSTAYDVVIAAGILEDPAHTIRSAAPAAAYAVIADWHVARLYGDGLCNALRTHTDHVQLFGFEPGENSKTRETWAALTDAMLDAKFGRDSCVVALGGGVTGDLAGFVAATYMRGLPLVQVPTTLLAMIDASVGGKTGVDTAAGKNLVGAFQQPRIVIADPLVLRSLPDEELRAGLAEAVKHGAIADASYLQETMVAALGLFARDPAALAALVRRSVEIKAEIVARDPQERGERARLNFGHTIAHALERLNGYTLRHGFAVAIGMVVEAAIGEYIGVSEPDTALALRHALQTFRLPTSLNHDLDPDALISAAATDKKARAQQLRFSLIRKPGASARTDAGDWTHPVDPVTLRAVLLSDLRA